MNEVKMEQQGMVRKLEFDFEKNTICIARKETEEDNIVLKYILSDILHLDDETVENAVKEMEENGRRILVSSYIRDVAKTFVYTITCYLKSINDDNYVVYIKDEEETN